MNSNFRAIKKLAVFGIGILAIPVFAACETNSVQAPTEPDTSVQRSPDLTGSPGVAPNAGAATADQDVDDVIANTPSLSTFAEVLDAAELQDTLEGDGPYTIFAPSDEAFAALPETTRQELLQSENQENLRQLLTYHIVPDQLTASELTSGEVPTALEGQSLNVQVDTNTDEVTVGNARVIQPDLQARNGVIHIVDQIILPPGASF